MNVLNKSLYPDLIKNSKYLNRYFFVLLSLLSSLLLNLSFPYPGVSIFAWISLIPLFIVIITEKPKKVILSALVTGLVFNVFYLSWLKEYKHPATLPGSVFAEILYFMLSVMLSWYLYRNTGLLREIALSVGWLSVDYLKTLGFLAFPWGILGYSQYKNLIMIQTASIFGVWGIDFLIIYFNATWSSIFVELLRSKKVKKSLINIPILICLFSATIFFGVKNRVEEKGSNYGSKRVALIQANFDPWSPELDENLTNQLSLTQKALMQNPDLIIWSESSVPFPFSYYLTKNNKYAKKIHNFISSLRKPFLFGSLEFKGVFEGEEFKGDFYNAAIYYREGKMDRVYRKIHLVPFGEWFPYKKLFPFVAKTLEEAGVGDFTPGNELVIFDGEGFKFNALICFEDVFGDLTRRFVESGSELLINITNDAWSGSKKAEEQHYSISIFRAIENRRSLVRAANGGVTASVNPYGRVIGVLELFTVNILVSDVPIVRGKGTTFYTRFGDLIPKIVLILVLVILFISFVKKVIDRLINRDKI